MVIGSFCCWPVTSVTRTDGDSFLYVESRASETGSESEGRV